jgi:hypothetical protein
MQRIYIPWHRRKGWKLAVFLNVKLRQDAGVSGNGGFRHEQAVTISVNRMNAML